MFYLMFNIKFAVAVINHGIHRGAAYRARVDISVENGEDFGS